MNSFETVRLIANYLDDKQAHDIVVLDTNDISSLADYFIIASADSVTQIKSLSSGVKDLLARYQQTPIHLDMDRGNRWHLLDYADVVIHLMHRNERGIYQLDEFWSHAIPINTHEWQYRQAS